MKRAFAIILLACIAAIAIYGYIHHRQVVKQREAFDAPSPGSVAPAAAAHHPANVQETSIKLVERLPSGATAIAFANVAALRDSSFANELASLAPSPTQDAAYTEFVRATGFDYTRDLDRAAVDLWTQTSPTSVLALAQGRFDQAKIERYALQSGGRTAEIYGHKIYEVREQNSTRVVRFTFLAPSEIALADGPALSQVLGPQISNRLDSQMSARVALVSSAPIYAIARTDDLPKDIGVGISHSAQLAGLLRSIRTISAAGHPAADNLKVFASAECDSTLNALKLSTALQGLLWMGRAALADPKTQQQIGPEWLALDALLKAADISHDGHLVELRVEVTPQMLQAAVAAPASSTKQK